MGSVNVCVWKVHNTLIAMEIYKRTCTVQKPQHVTLTGLTLDQPAFFRFHKYTGRCPATRTILT